MESLKLCEGLYWVGATHPSLRVFDIIMHSDYGTTYNAYLLRLAPAQWALIETCKMGFEKQLISRVEDVLKSEPEGAKITHIIHNHTEPDHSGSLSTLLKHPLFANAAIVASVPAHAYLKDIANSDFSSTTLIEVKAEAQEGEPDLVLDLGETRLAFHIAPFLHWPDSMFTYVLEGPAKGTAFTCDFLGAHYSPPEGAPVSEMASIPAPSNSFYPNYLESMKYYHDCIFGPFPSHSLFGTRILRGYLPELTRVCVSHGPIVTGETFETVLKSYEEWAQAAQTAAEAARATSGAVRATIAYVSAYGYTKEIAEVMGATMRAFDPRVEVELMDLVERSVEDAVASARGSNILCLGTPTINGDALPPIKAVADALNTVVDEGLVTHVFGSYGWSGEGVPIVASRLRHMRMAPPCAPQRWKFKPTDEDINRAKDIAKALLNKVMNGEDVPAELEDQDTGVEKAPKLPAEMLRKIKRWKCQVCGEIVTTQGGPPQDPCPICGASGDDVWIPILDGELAGEPTEQTAFDGTVLVVGGGPAGLNAALSARKTAPNSRVILVTMEDCPPYNRTKLTEAISHPELLADFCKALELVPRTRYNEMGITLMTQTKITGIDKQKHIATALDLRDNSERPIGYTKLVLATGAMPRIVPIPGLKEALGDGRAFTIRSAADIKGIHRRLAALEASGVETPHVVLIGGGLLSLESIPHWLEAGCRVSVIERCERICAQLDKGLSETLFDAISTRAIEMSGQEVEIYTQAATDAVHESTIELSVPTGTVSVPYDLLILSIGVVPNDELAKDAHLTTADPRCGGGITTALEMHTSDPAIYAAGDVASCGGARPAGNWASAVSHGTLAGRAAVDGTVNPEKDHNSTLSFLLKLWDTEVWTSSLTTTCPFAQVRDSATPRKRQVLKTEGEGHSTKVEMANGRPVSISTVNDRASSGLDSIGPKLVQALQQGDMRALEAALFQEE